MDSHSGPKEYWEKRLTENYSLNGTGFQTLGQQYNKWMYRIRKSIVKKYVKKTLTGLNSMNVFDVGSGTGFYVDMWLELGVRRVVGSDITDVAVKNLKRNYPHNEFYTLDIGEEELPNRLETEKFEIISAFDVLFHIIDDARYFTAIGNINKLLANGGFFFFSDNFLHRDPLRSRHQVSRSLASVEQTLHKTGFEILGRIPMFVIMNAPVDTRNRFLPVIWKLITSTAKKGEFASNITGCVLYPIETFLTTIGKEGPSTEMMICKKIESNV